VELPGPSGVLYSVAGMPRWPYTRGPHGLCVRHLGYAKRLRDTGIPTIEAEAQAEAAREFIMAELATRADLEVTRRELESSIGLLRRDMQSSAGILRRDLENSAGTLR
jgi:hypothetical protein